MKLKSILLAAASVAFTLKSHALINVAVSGGVGTPLTIEITQGDDFLTTVADTGSFFVLFENFWDNTQVSTTTSASVNTITMTTATSINSTGAFASGGFGVEDLLLGFNGSGFSNGQTITLGTGIRTTSGNLALDYTSLNAGGSAYLYAASGTVASGPVAYTVVPELTTYTALAGIAALTFVVVRRRK